MERKYKQLKRLTAKGEKYESIKRIIMINILDYELFPFDEYISKTVNVLGKYTEFRVVNGIEWYFVELPKFRRSHPDMNEKRNQWLAVIDDMDEELIEMAEKKNELLKKVRAEVVELSGEEAEKRKAYLMDKWERDYRDNRINKRRD